ncbi:hypothetical protein F0562_010885 [Nyssa sinensis]|uniref:Pentacotripeptide-repeat region of PRORP domain-containing protein n=1 Tax=Nyssa sinensis TaxID=561372 RepID=A0A5J5A3S7_9ASTE|nr:hypothetical protein F0562_010885 [Nyssa sinensis]
MVEYDRADRFHKGWRVGRIEMDSMADPESGSCLEPISLKHFLLTELFKTGGRQSSSKVKVSSDMESSVRKPRLTATLIDLYGKAGRLKDAADVFAEMLKSGVAVDTITLNTMISICGSHGNLSEAESVLGKMEERGISPDTKTYNIFLSLYADAGNIDAALQCYGKIREVDLFPDVVTHRAALQTLLCQTNMVQEVGTLIDEIGKSGMSIDEHSLPVIIKMFCYVKVGMVEGVKQIYSQLKYGDIEPNESLFKAIIDGYRSANKHDLIELITKR